MLPAMPQRAHWNVTGTIVASFVIAATLSTGMMATGSPLRADLVDFWNFINQWKSGQGSTSSEAPLSDSTNFVPAFSISDEYSSTSRTDEPVEEEHAVIEAETEADAPDSDENRSASALGYCCQIPGSGERCVQGLVGDCRGGSFFHGLTEDSRRTCEGRFACQMDVTAPLPSDESAACQRDPSFSVLTSLSDVEMTVLKTVIDRLDDISPSLVEELGAAVTCIDHAKNIPEEFVSAQEFEEFCESNKASWENLPESAVFGTDSMQGQSDAFPGGNFAGQAANSLCSGCVLSLLPSGTVTCVNAPGLSCGRTCQATQVTGAGLGRHGNGPAFYSMHLACQSQPANINPLLIECANTHRRRNVWSGYPCNASRPDGNNYCSITANNCPEGYICTASNVPGANCACAPTSCPSRYPDVGPGCSPSVRGINSGCSDSRALCQQAGNACACVVPAAPLCASRPAPDCGLTSPGSSTESRPGPGSGCTNATDVCTYVRGRVEYGCSCVTPGQR